MESNEKLTGAKKVFSTIATIFLLVTITFALISVWGTMTVVRSSSLARIEMNVSYFTFDMWEDASIIGNQMGQYYENLAYLGGFIQIFAFIAAVFVVYFFGVRAIIKGLGNLIENKKCSIVKDSVIICLTMLAYANISTYTPQLITGFTVNSISSGWGGSLAGTFCWMGMFFLLVYLVVSKFSKNDITGSIGFILACIPFLILPSVWNNIMEETMLVEFLGASPSRTPLGLFTLFIRSSRGDFGNASRQMVAFTIAEVCGIIVVLSSIALFIYLAICAIKLKKFNFPVILGLTIAMSICSLLASITAPNAFKGITGVHLYDQAFNDTFAASFFILVLLVSVGVLYNHKKKNNEEEKVVSEQEA